jgi:hypothetical protein
MLSQLAQWLPRLSETHSEPAPSRNLTFDRASVRKWVWGNFKRVSKGEPKQGKPVHKAGSSMRAQLRYSRHTHPSPGGVNKQVLRQLKPAQIYR